RHRHSAQRPAGGGAELRVARRCLRSGIERGDGLRGVCSRNGGTDRCSPATIVSELLDPGLLRRVEEAGINASAAPEQLWIDGWLVRFSPGKAKRARCVQAVAAGISSVEIRWQRCLAVYAGRGLRPYVRVTPFSQPAGLDEQLDAMGLERIDDTRVMVSLLPLAGSQPDVPPGARIQTPDAATFAEWIGFARGSSPGECRAHADRLM